MSGEGAQRAPALGRLLPRSPPRQQTPTCTGGLAVDQRRRLQPEPTALFLYKHKTKDEKQACWGRAIKPEGPGAAEACDLGFSGCGPGEPGTSRGGRGHFYNCLSVGAGGTSAHGVGGTRASQPVSPGLPSQKPKEQQRSVLRPAVLQAPQPKALSQTGESQPPGQTRTGGQSLSLAAALRLPRAGSHPGHAAQDWRGDRLEVVSPHSPP